MPTWAKYLIAFAAPALTTGIAVASKNGDKADLLFWLAALSAGVGGLAGIGVNKGADTLSGK